MIRPRSRPHRKADFLNRYNVEYGDPLAYKKEMADALRRHPGRRQASGQQVPDGEPHPGRRRPRADPAERAPEVAVDRQEPGTARDCSDGSDRQDTFDRRSSPKVGPAPKFTPPVVIRRKLSNGLEVLISERHELPILSLELVVKGGETLVPADKHGLASLTASLLTEGTTKRDSLKLCGRARRYRGVARCAGWSRIVQPHSDDAYQARGQGARAVHRRSPESNLPREGAEPAQNPAAAT